MGVLQWKDVKQHLERHIFEQAREEGRKEGRKGTEDYVVLVETLRDVTYLARTYWQYLLHCPPTPPLKRLLEILRLFFPGNI